ncbi:LOW QUALITY PROTEIN: hypothetical protein ACHAWX_003143 [Stephanocyclus meneghinianus]
MLVVANALVLLNYHSSFNLESTEDRGSFSPPRSKPHGRQGTISKDSLPTSLHPNNQRSADKIKPNIFALYNFTTEIHDPKKDNPFATQQRKGEKWTAPFRYGNNGEHWWKYSDSCFEVDNICRFSRNRWFYYTNDGSSNAGESEDNAPWQPTFQLEYAPFNYRAGVYADTRIQINAQSSNRVTWEELARGSECRVSSVPHHIVLQSLFNSYKKVMIESSFIYSLMISLVYQDMIGEFYTRTMMYVHRLLTFTMAMKTTHESKDKAYRTSVHGSSLINATQFYVHIAFHKPILDAHKLLLSGIHFLPKPSNYTTSNAIRSAKSAIDLVQPTNNDDCQCFQKLVFCGYDTYIQQPADANENQSGLTVQGNGEANYTLWPGRWVDSSGDEIEGVSPCNPVSPTFTLLPNVCQNYAKLKSFLLANIEATYSNIEENITDHRRDILQKQGLISESYDGDTKEWAIVGLTQRSSRRVWLNFSNAMDACKVNFLGSRTDQAKVICVEVNVEDTKSPHEQFLIHRSLDALIGVHGAQLTQGVFLRSGASVLELLPWVPDYLQGGWTARTSRPTPLGVIFHNTDLNHYGYSLDRRSVPLCQDVSPEHDKKCLMSEDIKRKFAWSERDFIVDISVVIQFIKKFVLGKKVPVCKDLQAKAMEEFVLYNVWCRDDDEVGTGANSSANEKRYVRHFYREKKAV